MYTTVQKWGNSQAVRIPKQIAEKLSLRDNEPVEIISENDAIVIRKTRRHRTLAERLEGYTGDYKFVELDSGAPMGKEVF